MICDGKGTPLKVITTAANVNDVTQTLTLVDAVPPAAGRVVHPRKHPEALLGDKGYDSEPSRRELRNAASCPPSPDATTPTSTAWANSATSSSRLPPCPTSSNDSPSTGNDATTSTTPSSR
ncbi:transposase [Streptomyces olivaceus]|uniref:Transposase n=1 Tax=Streptomyces olivaceus TaxID=47716 RepID=A0ABS7W5L0_STROV|nr:transposase [Streptomyces olivaceus]MBZ6096932.1 transposase [Streptomyces olivaceus]MBZ6119531.1 transposase [Streptomyces olivaceus]MBZ6153257.1 transposase [Streptomyces olivaceus]MBZ6299340.1 transposase [Streptomyces olivaceus]